MRKVVCLLLVGILLSTGVAFAGDLEDLQTERQELTQRMLEYNQVMQSIRDRLIALDALINYIQSKEISRVGTEGDIEVE